MVDDRIKDVMEDAELETRQNVTIDTSSLNQNRHPQRLWYTMEFSLSQKTSSGWNMSVKMRVTWKSCLVNPILSLFTAQLAKHSSSALIKTVQRYIPDTTPQSETSPATSNDSNYCNEFLLEYKFYYHQRSSPNFSHIVSRIYKMML